MARLIITKTAKLAFSKLSRLVILHKKAPIPPT